MGKMQRDKGASFERWVANEFKLAGFVDARRGLGQARSPGEVADVTGTPFWIECKHQIRVNIRRAYEQAEAAHTSADCHVPIVVSRDNGKPTLVTMALEDFLPIARDSAVEVRIIADPSRLTNALIEEAARAMDRPRTSPEPEPSPSLPRKEIPETVCEAFDRGRYGTAKRAVAAWRSSRVDDGAGAVSESSPAKEKP